MADPIVLRLPRQLLPLVLLAGCVSGPIDYPRNYSEAIEPTAETRLGREVEEWQESHTGLEGQSGYYPLVSGNDAFGARLALAELADRTIDVQYFLMKPDSAGLVFSASLIQAADRGVRVRFLLDDIFTTVDDTVLEFLNQHPNIEIRIFNPIGRGGFYYLNYLADFKRANRRMHNKSFTVDNLASIVGGRNIADEYFELGGKEEFRDFEMLAVGQIAEEVSAIFDRFWNHALSVPMEAFSKNAGALTIRDLDADFNEQKRNHAQAVYATAINSPLVQDLIDNRVPFFLATGRMVTDDPDKLLNKISAEQQNLVTVLAEVVSNAESEVVVATPYFIPGDAGVDFWRALVDKGVRVVILTNSLASNNHIPVHAAYARYRHDLIRAGIELYELKVDATDLPSNPDEEQFDSVTLHTKAVAVDRKILTIGSLNLDPRSIDINTEVALLIDSPELTGPLVSQVLDRLPITAYRLSEDEKGRLLWTTTVDGVQIIENVEPQAGKWRRFKAFMSRIFPESQL